MDHKARMRRIVGLLVLASLCLGSAEGVTPEEKARQLGANAAAELQKVLRSELAAAMQSGGPGQAIRVCSQKALLLTADIPRLMEIPTMTVKRTSLRWRNEMNRPDALETKVLQDMDAASREDAPLQPVMFVQSTTYHYFEPIRIVGMCLTCHGPEEKMPENIKATLDTLYPGDRARGYAPGEFRGVIHVTIPREEVAGP